MSSEEQKKANRENAKKSTGPKSEEGKAKSSRNAMKHGMCATVHCEGSEEFEKRLGLWTGSLAADGDPVKVDLVRLAVRAYHRADRGLRADEAEAERRVRDALSDWERERAERTIADVADLKENPTVAVKRLEATVHGCDWMIKTWKGLHEAMDKQLWKDQYHGRSRQLLGYDNLDPEASIRLPDAWQELIGAYMEFWRDQKRPIAFMPWHERVLTVEGLILATKRDQDLLWELFERGQPACESYKAVMKEEIARLEEIRVRLEPLEVADRAGAPERALVDGSEAGKLRLRYLAESQRDLYRALKELREMKRDEAKLAPRNEANRGTGSLAKNE